MKKISQKILMVAIIAFLLSCKKDGTSPSGIRLTKDTYSQNGYYTYTYDSDNNLTNQYYSGDSSGVNPSYDLTIDNIDSKGRIVQFTYNYASDPDIIATNSFNSAGKISREDFIDVPSGAPSSYYTISYTSNMTTVKYYFADGTLLRTYDYSYSAEGNLTSSHSYNPTLTSNFTQTYSDYDDKHSPDQLFPEGYLLNKASANNARHIVLVNNFTSTTLSDLTYTFEYNSDGYPVKRTSSSGRISTWEYAQ